jgi:heme A synthase
LLIVSALSALAGLILLALRRRRLGRQEAASFQRALQEGRVPDDADGEGWAAVVRSERRLGRRARGIAAVVFVLVVGAAVVAGLLNPALVWLAVLIAAVWVAVAVLAEVRLTRYLRRVERLGRALG